MTAETVLRPYRETDRSEVRRVCLEAASEHYRRHSEALWALYCDYYIDCAPEYITVVADETDRARGYIFCAPDAKKYAAEFSRVYLKRAGKCGLGFFAEGCAERSAALRYSREYPAHLHIDIDEGFRGGGLGAKLISGLCARLADEGVKGIMLEAGAANTGAHRFYLKNGFTLLKRGAGAYIFGRRLAGGD